MALLVLFVSLNSQPIVLWNDFRYAQIRYPSEYEQMANFLNQKSNEDFRILLLPPYPSVKHNWAPYLWISSLDGYLMKNPFFGRCVPERMEPLALDFSSSLIVAFQQNSLYLVNIFRLANVRYVVLMNDCLGSVNYADVLSSQHYIKLEKVFGDTFIYRVNEEYFLPHIYATSDVVLVNGSIGDMFKIVTSEDFNVSRSALFLSNQLNTSQLQFIRQYNGTAKNQNFLLTFQKIDSTRYKVYIKASRPFFLVFSESYSPLWKAYYGDVDWLKAFWANPISDDKHFPVNGYANAWYVDPKQLRIKSNEFTITIYYCPQSLFYMGWIVTSLTFIGCVSYLAWTNESEKTGIRMLAKRIRILHRDVNYRNPKILPPSLNSRLLPLQELRVRI